MIKYCYEMHLHTKEVSACAFVCAKKLVNEYKKAGYTGIVVTDHYSKGFFEGLRNISWDKKIEKYLLGYKAALKEGKKNNINVILGVELAMYDTYNDILMYGVTEEFLLKHPKLYDMELSKLRQIADENNILLYQAHPYRHYITELYDNYVHGIEVYNGNIRHDAKNHLALELANKKGLLKISGSDYHEIEDLARGGIKIDNAPKTAKELFNILKANENIELIIT